MIVMYVHMHVCSDMSYVHVHIFDKPMCSDIHIPSEYLYLFSTFFVCLFHFLFYRNIMQRSTSSPILWTVTSIASPIRIYFTLQVSGCIDTYAV